MRLLSLVFLLSTVAVTAHAQGNLGAFDFTVGIVASTDNAPGYEGLGR